MTTSLRVEHLGPAALLTLHRPEARNELTLEMLQGLRDALADADADREVDAIVLTGSDPDFCGGLDLDSLASEDFVDAVFSDTDIWGPLGKPVIGAVNGWAERGGLELALQCDFLIASQRAGFADTHAGLGIVHALGLSTLLPQVVGPGWAKRMSLTGEAVSAELALRIGLVTEVVPHERLRERALELAGMVAGADAVSVRALLRSWRTARKETGRFGFQAELTAHRERLAAADDPASGAVLAAVERRLEREQRDVPAAG
jgi:enoyl-CoA hydratase